MPMINYLVNWFKQQIQSLTQQIGGSIKVYFSIEILKINIFRMENCNSQGEALGTSEEKHKQSEDFFPKEG